MTEMLCRSVPAFGTTTVIRDIGKSLQQEELLVWLDQRVAISMHSVLPSNSRLAGVFSSWLGVVENS